MKEFMVIQALRVSGFLFFVASLSAAVLAGCSTTSAVPTDPAPGTPACTYEGGSLPSLEVAAGETCVLNGTTVQGDITLASGASLDASLGVAVGGDIQGQGAANVLLDGTTVAGKLQLGGGGAVAVTDSSVEGRLQLAGNRGVVSVSDTFIGGDLLLLQNTGGVFVDYNVVTGDVQCEQNDPAPLGADNEVSGSKGGQCRAL